MYEWWKKYVKCLDNFVEKEIEIFGGSTITSNVLKILDKHDFADMINNIDHMQWELRNCPLTSQN